MKRQEAEKLIGTQVAAGTAANGSYVGELVAVLPLRPWRGRVRITGVLEAATVWEWGRYIRAGFRPGDEIEVGGVNIVPTDKPGTTYLEVLERELAWAENTLRDIEQRAYKGGLALYRHMVERLKEAVELEKAGKLAKKRDPLPQVQGKVAAQYIDEEWRELLLSLRWKPYSSGENFQRWFHPSSSIQISIEYPKDDYPFYTVWDRDTKKELVRGRDTKSLAAYAEPEAPKEGPVRHGKEPTPEEIEALSREMGIRWSSLRSPLLASCFKPVLSALYTVEDLDEQDSQIAHDLMALHDEIMDAPVRGVVPDYGGSYQAQRLYNFTYEALRGRLLPAVVGAARRLPKTPRGAVVALVDRAIEKLTESQDELDTRGLGGGSMAGIYLEEAFMRLHEAIEVIRDATREEKQWQ